MLKRSILYASAISSFFTSTALAAHGTLQVKVTGIEEGQMIPEKFAYCIMDGKGKGTTGPNINPEISWSGAPEGTKSYAVFVVDSEVPQSFSSANRENKTVSADTPRRDFYHWVLFNVPASLSSIKEGQNSTKVEPNGKPVGKTDYGVNGRNDYTGMKEKVVGGYDGPCPPWNDEKIHRYHFQVYALDTDNVDLPEDSGGLTVMQSITPHILAKGEVTGIYTLNANLAKNESRQ